MYTRPMMVFMVLVAFLFSIPAIAGEKKIGKKDVPTAVQRAFEATYPNATVKAYARETEDEKTFYELEPVDGTTKRDLLYTLEGKAAEIEETVTLKDLPEVVAKAFAMESPKMKPTRIEKVTVGEKVTFEFSMGKGKTELVMDPTGVVVKHSKAVKAKGEKEDEEDEKAEGQSGG
jgi:hypothetical protein